MIVAMALWGIGMSAAEPPPSEPAPDATSIRERIRTVETLEGMEAEVKARMLSLYREALADMEETAQWTDRLRQTEKRIEQAPKDLKTIRGLLAVPEKDVSAPSKGDSTEIRSRVAAAETVLQEKREALNRAEEELKQRYVVTVEHPRQVLEDQRELASVSERMVGLSLKDMANEENLAENLRWKVRGQLLRVRIQARETEREFYEGHGELLLVRRDLAARELDGATARVDMLRRALNNLQDAEKRAAEKEAERASAGLSELAPALRDVAAVNADLALRRALIQPRISEAESRLQSVSAQLARLESEFENLKSEGEGSRSSRNFGVLARSFRSTLPDPRALIRERDRLRDDIDEAQFSAVELQQQRGALTDLGARAKQILESLPPEDARHPGIDTDIVRLLRQRRELLFQLWDDTNQLIKNLVALDIRQGMLADRVETSLRFIDERILWTPSRRPLSLADATTVGKGLKSFFLPAFWKSMAGDLIRVPVRDGLRLILLLLVFLGIWRARRPIRRHLAEIATRVSSPASARFRDTVFTSLYVLVLALPWPLLTAGIGFSLTSSAETGDPARALGVGLVDMAGLWYSLVLIRQIAHPDGLAGRHFHWPLDALSPLRDRLLRLLATALPLAFFTAFTQSFPNDAGREVLGMIGFIAGMGVASIFLHRTLHPAGGVFSSWLARHPGSGANRFRYLWFGAVLLVPPVLAVLAGMGYPFTALCLCSQLWRSLLVVLAAVWLHALCIRWLRLARVKLVLERAAQSASGETPPAPEEDFSLPEISERARRIMVSFIIVATFFLLLGIWSQELPALTMLRQIPVWPGGMTLADLGSAALAVVITVIATRNLPGLLDIGVLQYLPLEPGTRYAILTLTRYGLGTAGAVTAFGLAGLRWSQVQWIVAAVTFGIGFGLQEIFANFISGLIILFERPIRVGDTLTIGGVSGTVTRIRIRATTIRDWDRKELVIPNKMFVTGEIINWDLTETTLRVVVPVGVAYGSDTRLVRELLLKAAHDCPLVLKDPPANAFSSNSGKAA